MTNNSNQENQNHIDFYKYLSGLSLATFAGCITLLTTFDHSPWLLLVASYSALASAFMSLYTIKTILTEGRIPFYNPGPLTGRLSKYVAYKLLLLSLGIVAIVIMSASLALTTEISTTAELLEDDKNKEISVK